jgi:murein DD-endopeptidase MepM/ murein hydrolase activator NlpD
MPKPLPPDPQPQPTPTPPAPTPKPSPPAPPPDTPLSHLTGVVRTHRPNGAAPYGVPWSNITRSEPSFTNAAKEFGLADGPALMAAMAIVESDGNQTVNGHVVSRDDGLGDGPSVGILQVKPKIWQSLVMNADPMTADGNIRLGTAIMAQAIKKYGSWQKALTTVYFPQNDANGTTQSAYVQTVTSLLAEIAQNVAPAPPPPSPPPTPPADVDPIRVIVGGDYPAISYGWCANAGLNYYSYGQGHGTQSRYEHTGIDVPVPGDTPLYAPAPGVVDCVGAAGTPRWGEGCGAYNDEMPGGGIGNITILLDTGHRLVLGHCHKAFVSPGDRVKAGQKVGLSGGMNGFHVHCEVAIYAPDKVDWSIALNGGDYFLVEPISALKDAIAGKKPVAYAPRVDIPQPAKFDVSAKVVATADAVPVLQRADRNSSAVRQPLSKGEEFQAVYQVIGDDKQIYWVTTLSSRVPVEGTRSDEWPG